MLSIHTASQSIGISHMHAHIHTTWNSLKLVIYSLSSPTNSIYLNCCIPSIPSTLSPYFSCLNYFNLPSQSPKWLVITSTIKVSIFQKKFTYPSDNARFNCNFTLYSTCGLLEMMNAHHCNDERSSFSWLTVTFCCHVTQIHYFIVMWLRFDLSVKHLVVGHTTNIK